MWNFLFAAAVALQAPTVEELAGRLGDESPLVREEAAKELIKRCDESAPVIRKQLPGASGDLWKLYDLVLDRCEGESRRRLFLGPPSKVSFSAENRPLSECLEDFGRRLDCPLGKGDIPDRPLTVDFKDVPLLEAFDRVCRAAQLSWRSHWAGSYGPPLGKRPTLTFSGGPAPPKEPRVLYLKNYRVTLGGVQMTRHRTPVKDESNAGISLVIQPLPRLGDMALDVMTCEQVVDDRGAVLSISDPAKPGPARRHRDSRLDGASPLGHLPWFAQMKHPDPEAKSISILGLKATLRCELERRYLALEASEKAIGQVVEYEGVKVRLSMHRIEEGKLIIGVIQEGRRTPADASDTCWPVGEQRFEHGELRMKDGSTVRVEGVPRPVGREGERLYTFPLSGEAAEFRFVTYRVWAFDSIEFEFRDLPIPK